MYSANPSGNSTLSCNAGSIILLPECPWVARKYRNRRREFEFKQYWNPFLLSSTWYPFFYRPTRSIVELLLPALFNGIIGMDSSRDWLIMSKQSGDCFWHFKTLMIEWSLCFDVNPSSFMNRNRIWGQRYCKFLSWSRVSIGFPRSFSDECVNNVHNSNPRYGLILK